VGIKNRLGAAVAAGPFRHTVGPEPNRCEANRGGMPGVNSGKGTGPQDFRIARNAIRSQLAQVKLGRAAAATQSRSRRLRRTGHFNDGIPRLKAPYCGAPTSGSCVVGTGNRSGKVLAERPVFSVRGNLGSWRANRPRAAKPRRSCQFEKGALDPPRDPNERMIRQNGPSPSHCGSANSRGPYSCRLLAASINTGRPSSIDESVLTAPTGCPSRAANLRIVREPIVARDEWRTVLVARADQFSLDDADRFGSLFRIFRYSQPTSP